MKDIQLRHLSYVKDSRDGGIATAVNGLVQAQQQAGLGAHWLDVEQLDQLADLHPATTILHVHGLWRRPSRRSYQWSQQGFHCVIAPHGMLDPWAMTQSRVRKQLVWGLWEHRALINARCLHALCPAEASAIRALLPTPPIAVIPNGIKLPNPHGEAILPATPWAGVIPDGASVLLFLGRFHSKKGLAPLLAAWQAVADDALRTGWWLVFVGYGDDGSLQRHLRNHPIPHAKAFGAVSGEAKEATLAASTAFVLPSYSEGLPMAALEAMSHRLPCLLSSHCNLPEAFSCGAALAAEPDPDALRQSLLALFALTPGERAAMGAAGEALVRSRYSWSQVAEQSAELYRWLLGGGDRPGFMEV